LDRFSFTLQIDGLDPNLEDYEDRLFLAGCDDALVAVINGQMFVDFDRQAASYEAAISSACSDIETAGGLVVRALPLEGR
jgi:hypothetical protein